MKRNGKPSPNRSIEGLQTVIAQGSEAYDSLGPPRYLSHVLG